MKQNFFQMEGLESNQEVFTFSREDICFENSFFTAQ